MIIDNKMSEAFRVYKMISKILYFYKKIIFFIYFEICSFFVLILWFMNFYRNMSIERSFLIIKNIFSEK